MSFQLHAFDLPYLERLRCGDVLTQEHFADYFSRFIRLKLGRRLRSQPVIEDVRQETFVRVWVALRKDKGIRQPERFGAFVNSVCNNVLREHNRPPLVGAQSEDGIADTLTDNALGVVDILAARQLRQQVDRVLAELPVLYSDLIRKFFWEERDRDELCRDFGVSRQYLRVLLHRATRRFRKLYLKRNPSTTAEPLRKSSGDSSHGELRRQRIVPQDRDSIRRLSRGAPSLGAFCETCECRQRGAAPPSQLCEATLTASPALSPSANPR